VSDRTLSLFEGYGIEIELAVVDRDTLDVRPLVDELLRAASGADEYVEDVDDGPIGWSNELVGHVVELKTNGPVPSFEGVADAFNASVLRAEALLGERWNARLLPTGMHPWMEPARETVLWKHEHGPVYGAYDRLFDCRRHGWANVQSVHLNLPFADEHEFGRLMAAARVVLPLIPALAASSPLVEGRSSGRLDSRLEFYRLNSARAPSMTGRVIPEPIWSAAEYRERIFRAIDRDLAQLGAEPVLLGREFANARGAIARFDRMAIEVRLIDAQESPRADLAVAGAVAGLVRALVEERWCSLARQQEVSSEPLIELLARAVDRGPDAELVEGYAELFGLAPAEAATAGDLWRARAEDCTVGSSDLEEPLRVALERGTLAQRILAALDGSTDRAKIRDVYTALAECLRENASFAP
jgi:gamma-glutamyl:cysteine ligase YbdK (ATP-grasp superfamily)